MANEVLLAAIGDITLQESINGTFLQMLADRNALPQHPALVYVGAINDTLSNVIKVPHLALDGYTAAAAAAEASSIANTPWQDGSSLVTVTGQGKAIEASDIARMINGKVLNPQAFAQDAYMAHMLRMTDIIANIIDGFTATVGSTGVDLDLTVIMAALGSAVVNNVNGPFLGMLHGQQWADLMTDAALVAGGALQWQPATAELAVLRGSGYKGNYLGVDWFQSNRVVTANGGADRAGAIWGPGAVLWADGQPPLDDPSRQMLIGGKVLFENVRDGRARTSSFVSSSYLGASIGLQAGCSIITDA